MCFFVSYVKVSLAYDLRNPFFFSCNVLSKVKREEVAAAEVVKLFKSKTIDNNGDNLGHDTAAAYYFSCLMVKIVTNIQ
jgi:hypothetical protein